MKRTVLFLALSLLTLAAIGVEGCSESKPTFEKQVAPIYHDLNYFKDAYGRYVHFRGVNVGGSTKAPIFDPDFQVLDVPIGKARGFTYVGRPFVPGEEDKWFSQLRGLGFNAIRLLFIWEAVFPDEKGKPDQEFLDYFERIIAKANEHGIYVMLNMHENMWSRHLWAYYNEEYPKTCKPGDGLCLDDILLPILPSAMDREREATRDYIGSLYSDKVVGDGAPLWATKLCLPEKNFDSPYWGMQHILGRIHNPTEIGDYMLGELAKALKDMLGIDLSAAKELIMERSPKKFELTDTSDFLPWTFWGTNNAFSLDVERCYAALFAGDIVYPDHKVVRLADNSYHTIYDPAPAEGEEAADPITALDGVSIARSQIQNTWSLEDFMQESFTDAWVEVAKIGKKYPNVIGYDIMNEPASIFILLTVVAAYFQVDGPSLAQDLLASLLNQTDEDGNITDTLGNDLWLLIKQFELIPTGWEDIEDEEQKQQVKQEIMQKWGFIGGNLGAMLGLNTGFGRNHLRPLFERTGQAILDVYCEETRNMTDENGHTEEKCVWSGANRPTIFLEPAFSPDMLLGAGGGLGGQWMNYMRLPRFAPKYQPVQMSYSPHWYPDIYPQLGFNQDPRQFTEYEYNHRDYVENLSEGVDFAAFSLDNIPVLFGEFGTYWNYRYQQCEPPSAENDHNPLYTEPCAYYDNPDGQGPCGATTDKPRPDNDPNAPYESGEELPGYEQSRCFNYEISAQILDNYYEAMEEMMLSNIIWCYTTDNDPVYGDWWNHEDFSIIDENGDPRGEEAYVRPYPKAMSGKPVSMHFYSDYHYYDPEKGETDPWHEFELVFKSKETGAPTVIFVPNIQYPQGFYVWLSDGWVAWDAEHQELYYHPTADAPGVEHKVTIRPPIKGQDISGWKYFIRGEEVVGR